MTGSMIEVMNRRTKDTAEEKTDEKTEEQEQVRA